MNFSQLQKRVEELKKSGSFDLSTEEDLTLAVMNLISLEEHFFMTAEKTGFQEYFGLLDKTREIRKGLLAKMIPVHEGETWCISKHLLAATMRLMEAGTKTRDKKYFDLAYQVFSMFWAIRLKLVKIPELKKIAHEESWSLEDITTKLVDCCKE